MYSVFGCIFFRFVIYFGTLNAKNNSISMFVPEDTCLSSAAATVTSVKTNNVILNDDLTQTDHYKETE